MRERVEELVGRRARAMWVMTFHSACARMLRSDAERLGYTRGFTIYDEADSVRLVKQCVDELGVDPEALRPARDQAPDLRRQEPAARRRGLPAEGRLLLRADRGRGLRALRAADPLDERDGLRRPAVPHASTSSSSSPRCSSATSARSATPRRRVPGHQPRPVPLAAAAGGRAPESGGGRRRRAVPGRRARS